ncbi:MAG: rhodanese-like domain-containing protein [Limnoraphis sp. WC205]|jgi:rhodanese-related sulfurtransferase|nr:rhodanese-like domain-containing protein [Limnoraphis sp. WC205]
MSILTTDQQSVINLSPTEFINQPNLPLLIDVRSQLEYKTSHASNTRNLSLPRIIMGVGLGWRWMLPEWFRQLPKEQPIAVICLTAHRSPIAANQLLKTGFTQVFNITGGMVEWKRLGLEKTK